jgi:hypothetical protein
MPEKPLGFASCTYFAAVHIGPGTKKNKKKKGIGVGSNLETNKD